MSSVVELCNIALSHVGAYFIQDLNEPTKEARECKIHYEPARDTVLREHKWGFATKRQLLALLTENYSGWAYAYQYPTDCLVAREIYNDVNTRLLWCCDDDRQALYDKIEFEKAVNSTLNSKLILTNKENAELIYTARIEDTNLFDSIFRDMLSFYLAFRLVQPLRAKATLKQSLMLDYTRLAVRAKAIDANERHKSPNTDNSFVRARR